MMTRIERGSSLNTLRIISVACIVIVMLILSTSSAVVAASSSSVSIGSATVNVGESVTLPLMLENAAEEISCAAIVLSYNKAVAQVTSVDNSDFNAFVYNADNAQGKTTIVVYQTGESGLTGTIKIADVTIKGAGSGSSSLNLEIGTLKNNAGVSVSAGTVSGSFTVKSSGGDSEESITTSTPTPSPSPSPTPSPNVTDTPSPSPSPSQPEEPGIVTVRVGDVLVGEDGETAVTITINNVGGEGLSSARMNLTFDPKIVKVLSAENSDFDEFMSNIEKGAIQMVGYQTGAAGLKGDVVFVELRLKAIGKEGTVSELEVEVAELFENVPPPGKEITDFVVEAGSFKIATPIAAAAPTAASGDSKPLIPTIDAKETLALIIGSFLVVLRKRRR